MINSNVDQRQILIGGQSLELAETDKENHSRRWSSSQHPLGDRQPTFFASMHLPQHCPVESCWILLNQLNAFTRPAEHMLLCPGVSIPLPHTAKSPRCHVKKPAAKSPGKSITYGHICQHVVIRSTVVRQLVDWCTKQIIDDQNCIVQGEVLRVSSCRKRRRCFYTTPNHPLWLLGSPGLIPCSSTRFNKGRRRQWSTVFLEKPKQWWE